MLDLTATSPNAPINEGYQRFLAAFRDGTVVAGAVVTQQELCRILGLSLTPLRECLVVLQECGLVEIRPRSGIRIVYPEVSFFRENMQFRSIIEARAVERFAEVADPTSVRELQQDHTNCLARLDSDEQLTAIKPTMLALDFKLHPMIVAALQNRAITATHSRIMDNLSIAKHVHQHAVFRVQLHETVTEHLEILEAVLERDTKRAALALESHLRASTHRIFS